MGTSRRLASPWDIPVESLIYAVTQEFPPKALSLNSEQSLRARFRRALEQAYTLGRQDGQKLERGKSVAVALETNS